MSVIEMGKIKTSVSIDEKTLARVKEIAKREDRSVSYILEKLIQSIVQETPDAPFLKAPTHHRRISYSKDRRH